jgi:hypothetical protein
VFIAPVNMLVTDCTGPGSFVANVGFLVEVSVDAGTWSTSAKVMTDSAGCANE